MPSASGGFVGSVDQGEFHLVELRGLKSERAEIALCPVPHLGATYGNCE